MVQFLTSRLFQYPQSDRALCNLPSDGRAVIVAVSFSIPNRIEPSATRAPRSGMPRRSPLSVSPIGSSPLQPICAFSGISSAMLSVSPIGSSPLQLAGLRSAAPGSGPLSVSPIGSSPLQPYPASLFDPALYSFQYPQSDRALCNRCRLDRPAAKPHSFQYPQSDRALCNQCEGGRRSCCRCCLSVSPIGSSPLQR